MCRSDYLCVARYSNVLKKVSIGWSSWGFFVGVSSFTVLRRIWCGHLSELFEKTRLQHHFSCPDRHGRVTEQPSEVEYWSPACPYFVSLCYPLLTF
jgi:hypothetical protein